MSNTETNKWEIDILTRWYEAYMKIVRTFGTIAVTIIFFTANFLLKDLLTGEFTAKEELIHEVLDTTFSSFIWLSISLCFTFLCMIFTYNWYRTGISVAMNSIEESESLLPDKFWYHKAWLSMNATGSISWVCGGIAGITLMIGIVQFGLRISALLSI